MSFSQSHICFSYIECTTDIISCVVSITTVVSCKVVFSYDRRCNIKYCLMVFINAYRSVITAVNYKIYSACCIIWKSDCNSFVITVNDIRTVFFQFNSAVLSDSKFSCNGYWVVVTVSTVDYSYIVSWIYCRFAYNVF